MRDHAAYFVPVLIAMLLDVLGPRWLPRGFARFGVPLFRMRLAYDAAPIPADLEGHLSEDARLSGHGTLDVRRVSGSELAFRDRLFEWTVLRRTPLMHGHIAFSPAERAITVTGRCNWSTITFVGVVVSLLGGDAADCGGVFLAFLGLVLVTTYRAEAAKFRSVAEALAARARSAA